MSGIDLRLGKLFGGKKNLVISALDHVMEYGDQAGIEDPQRAIRACDGTDALLMSRFMLHRNAELMGRTNAPVPVVRINWSSSFYYPLDYREGNTCIATTVEDAVQAGAGVGDLLAFPGGEECPGARDGQRAGVLARWCARRSGWAFR